MARKTEAPENLEQVITELEQKLDRLRVLYEQYFLGIEKIPPTNRQRDVVRIIREIGNYHIQSSAPKFRYTALVQRFNVHRAYWARNVREIEEGTYKRHRFKVERRELARSGEKIDNAELAKRAMLQRMLGDDAVEKRRERLQEESPEAERPEYLPAVQRKRRRRGKKPQLVIRGTPLAEIEKKNVALAEEVPEVETTPATSESAPVPPEQLPSANAQQPPPVATPPKLPSSVSAPVEEVSVPRMPTLVRRPDWDGIPQSLSNAATELKGAGLTESRARRIYDELMAARQRQGESTQNISFDRIVKSMAKQIPKVQKSHGTRDVDFQVVTKNNKTYLKPVPK